MGCDRSGLHWMKVKRNWSNWRRIISQSILVLQMWLLKHLVHEILQVDPSSNTLGVSSIDYSSAPLYSQTLKKYLGLETSSSQYVIYALSIAGLFRTVRGFYRAHHLLQAARSPAGSETRIIHRFKADAEEHEIERAGAYAAWFASKEVKFRLQAPFLYVTWYLSKFLSSMKKRGN